MAYHKILIDYSEYMRLKSCEEKYESLLRKSGTNLEGGGDLSTIANEIEDKAEIQTPLLRIGPSITTPVNAQTKNIEENLGKNEKTLNSESLTWYYIGYPTKQ